MNGATAQVADFIIRQLLETSELPKIIIWADGSRAFNSGREDLTFNSISSSKGYQQVLQKAQGNGTNQSVQKSENSALSKQNLVDKPEINGYETVNQWLTQSLGNFSASYQRRDLIKTLLQKPINYLPFSSGNQISFTKTKTNHDNPEEDNSQQAVDFDGFLPLSIQFYPGRYYQKHPRVQGNYDNDYKSFQIGGNQDAACQALLQFIQERKISLVFVNMPLTQDYLDPYRRKYEQDFQQYMLSLTSNPNFIYRDLSQIWLNKNDYFSDPSHLNRYGAYEISKKLANDPLIPWPVK